MRKRVFIYIRVSTKEQAEEGYSIGEQEERLKKYCEAMEWDVVKIYIDPGFTGSDMNRPALQDMIKEIKKGTADTVLVDKLDRLSRSQFDTLYLIKMVFTANNCAFVSRAEAFDTSTPFGRAMVGILAVFAELERERIKERMIDGKDGRAKEGKYHGGGNVPTGYEYNQDTGALEVNEYEAMQIREVFDLFVCRTPLQRIAKILNEKGYRTKYGDWNDQRIRRIVKNPVYIGIMQHKGTNYEGMHEAIISRELYEKAQEIAEERDRLFAKHKPGRQYKSPLGGLIWCAHCGAKYMWRKDGQKKDGTPRCYYVCYSRSKTDKNMIKDKNCKNKRYRDFELEDIIYKEILKLKESETYVDDIQESYNTKDRQEQIKKRIDQIDGQVSKLIDMYTMDGIDLEVVKGKMSVLQEEKAKLENELEKLVSETKKTSKVDVLKNVSRFEQIKKSGDTQKLHAAIATLIQGIAIDGETIRIHWNF